MEWWFGLGAAILFGGLIYGVIRAGRLSRRERQRTDAATREMQRQEGLRQKD
jgi:hypothetical protein